MNLKTAFLVGTAFVLNSSAQAQLTVITTSGSNAAAITPVVNVFRTLTSQGGGNNGVGGSFLDGRREINWDAVGNAFSAPNNLPANFFNSNSARGAVFTPFGSTTGFQVSDNAAGGNGAGVRFDNLNATYSSTFTNVFSNEKLFTTLGGNSMDVTFFIPGTNLFGSVSGFGVVFADVDTANSARVEFYDTAGNLILSQTAPASNTDGGLSFVGAFATDGFSDPIGRVRIFSGTNALGGNEDLGNGVDLVVMDDFIYGEPTAVPEPMTIFLVATSSAGFTYVTYRRWKGKQTKRTWAKKQAATAS